MKGAFAFTVLLAAATAYYFYLPLPNTVSEPWKLMIFDGVLRGMLHAGRLADSLGICHFLQVLNYTMNLATLDSMSGENLLVTDTTMGGVEVRICQWTGGAEHELKRGVVYFHGGGWALGSAKKGSYYLLCRKMAEDLKAVVLSVDYRLAPESHFPDQFEDAFRASKHFLQPEVLAHYSVDPERVGVSGDSAGGNLAAAVAQQVATDSSISVKFKVQSLVYPALQALDFNTPSYQQNQNAPVLQRWLVVWFWLEYLNADHSFSDSATINNHSALDLHRVDPFRSKVDWTALLPPRFREGYEPVVQAHGTPRMADEVPGLLDARAFPLLAEREVLARTPRAYVLTCEHDVLRDDGLMYVRRLEEAGVAVTSDYYEDGFHGCLTFGFWPTIFSVGNRTLTNYIAWLDRNL
ncbi:neutral cholesterol ester hydrolase 1-like [Anguilla anguilla]|uniref:neutral cholesterol ester hydrolase 1-like n=1 Tax=Anguilla anguilla TaxID=7936 RepID=UPI0015B153FB|nr:neutral cholesterol ester hydrolase 1-like [Anguilla anguilla]